MKLDKNIPLIVNPKNVREILDSHRDVIERVKDGTEFADYITHKLNEYKGDDIYVKFNLYRELNGKLAGILRNLKPIKDELWYYNIPQRKDNLDSKYFHYIQQAYMDIRELSFMFDNTIDNLSKIINFNPTKNRRHY